MAPRKESLKEHRSVESIPALVQKQSLIFVAGISARSGTTYLLRLLVTHPDVCRPQGHWELPLFDVADKFVEFHKAFLRRRHSERLDYSMDQFAGCFGKGLMQLLIERVLPSDRAARYLLHKNPGTRGIEHFSRFFPDGKLVFILRDGRDCVNSLLAAEGFRNNSWRRLRKNSWWNLNRLRHIYLYTQEWTKSARRILAYVAQPDADCLVVKYEDLHRDPKLVLRRVAAHIDVAVSDHWLNEIANMPVKGSNFYGLDGSTKENTGHTNWTNWKEMPKTAEFNPIGRWRGSWSSLDKLVFNKVAGCEMRELGYEE